MVEPKSLAKVLLYFNLCLYTIVLSIGGWAVNYAIDHGFFIDKGFKLRPGHFSPIYFPTGNATTGFFVLFSLIAGAAGVASAICGLIHLYYLDSEESVPSAAFAGTIAWTLTLLAIGFACKQIDLHRRNSCLKTMETFTIILSATQLYYVGAILVYIPKGKNENQPSQKK